VPFNSELSINVALGNVLRNKHPDWEVGAEQSAVFRERARRPDVLVRPARQPVVIETEFVPGSGVEADAIARLGATLRDTGDAVEQAIAVLIPEQLREGQQALEERVEQSVFRFALYSGGRESPIRWPESGWLEGDSNALATVVEYAALSEHIITRGADILQNAVREAAGNLRESAPSEDMLAELAEKLCQHDSRQTTLMAMAIVANALAFHMSIAGTHAIEPLGEFRGAGGRLGKTRLLRCWQRILEEINYWPIFKIASDLLRPIPVALAGIILDRLAGAAEELAEIGALGMHDLAGQMFQRLIADRKFLATFYTLPTSAALLAKLGVGRLEVDWTDDEAVTELRIADLACGTGTLLSAAYQAIRSRYRYAGGDDSRLHAAMMEGVLIGADIMPAATHLTASMLSGAHPGLPFSNTKIVTCPYGEQPTESGHPLAIGSLDLIEDESARSVLGTHPGQLEAFGLGREEVSGTGESREQDDGTRVQLPHLRGDLLIMNPPFTRPTNHEITDVPIPSFAGFATSQDEQRAMSRQLARIRRGLTEPAGHGNAGLASNFFDLAHVKTRPGGVVALVLPASFVQGGAWAQCRNLLCRYYERAMVVSIAVSGQHDRAFSADTGMAEVLVVASKKAEGPSEDLQTTLFVNLYRRPQSLVEAAVLAGEIHRLEPDARSGRLRVGEESVGVFLRAPLSEGGCAGIREPILAETMMALASSELRLPRRLEHLAVPMTRLGSLGRRGRLDRDINGRDSNGRPRGPFDIVPAGPVPEFPVLWSHDAERERSMVVSPEAEGQTRSGCEEQAIELWRHDTSRLHYSRDFQINSQSLAACLTPTPSIGGRAWPNFILDDEAWEKLLTLWANSTLGLLSFWWIGTRQHQGRAVLTIGRLPELLVLDPRGLSTDRLRRAEAIFERFLSVRFLPANEAYRDEARAELDRAVLVDLLGCPADALEDLAVLREKWCWEPTVHGGKATAPSTAAIDG